MKCIFCLLFSLSLAFANAQDYNFLRVYNLKGKKINRGHLFQLSDSTITLTRKNNFIESPVREIGMIKSKRTTGHRILVTTASVVSLVAIFAVITQGNKNGSGPGIFNPNGQSNKSKQPKSLPPAKPFKRYRIDGNVQKWQEQRGYLIILL
jgi:hypothetical protein